jgi:hypothetical protein
MLVASFVLWFSLDLACFDLACFDLARFGHV